MLFHGLFLSSRQIGRFYARPAVRPGADLPGMAATQCDGRTVSSSCPAEAGALSD